MRPVSSVSDWCVSRSTSTTRTGSRTPTSISSSTSATSPCRRPVTGASSASRWPASCRDRSTTNRPLWELYVIEGLDNVEGRPEGELRPRHEGAPRSHRRHVGHGDDQRDPRRRAGRRALARAGEALASGARADHGRAVDRAPAPTTLARPMHASRVAGSRRPPTRTVAAPGAQAHDHAADDDHPAHSLERPGDGAPGRSTPSASSSTTCAGSRRRSPAPPSTTSC